MHLTNVELVTQPHGKKLIHVVLNTELYPLNQIHLIQRPGEQSQTLVGLMPVVVLGVQFTKMFCVYCSPLWEKGDTGFGRKWKKEMTWHQGKYLICIPHTSKQPGKGCNSDACKSKDYNANLLVKKRKLYPSTSRHERLNIYELLQWYLSSQTRV